MDLTEIPWGPQGELVYDRTYSRTKPDGTKETWPETVERVVDGNLALVDPRHHLRGERESLIKFMERFAILPAGRHLWASGTQHSNLFNCFAAGTQVHTIDGVVPIESLTGRAVQVLSADGQYRSAVFSSYGHQALFRVVLSSGEQFYATGDHEWVTYNSGVTYRHKTVDLAGKRIPYNPAPRPDEDESYRRGVAHGIVYGDGTRSGSKSTMVNLFGGKRDLIARLRMFARNEAIEHADRTYIGTLPADWKNLPGAGCPRSYWRGFINGLVATDGNVRSGSVRIHQVDSDALTDIREGAMYAGYIPTNITRERTTSPYTGEEAPLYCLTLRGWSFDKDDFVRADQREAFNPMRCNMHTQRVSRVDATGLFREVYCAVEPETHTITVGSGLLTGQCWVAGWTNVPAEHFVFTFLRLMEGGGVGANYSNRYLEHLPGTYGPHKVHVVCSSEHADYQKLKDAGLLSSVYSADWPGPFEVEDSREGWAAALADLFDAYYRPARNAARVFDVSRVRPAGSRLKTFGGTASGPVPLAEMLHEVAAILNRAEFGGSHKLSGLDAMEIDHAIAKCVVSGGARRSARMSIMAWNDPQIGGFLRCKSETGKHWTTNVSVEVDEDFWAALEDDVDDPWELETNTLSSHSHAVLRKIAQGMLTNGEPGIWNSSLSNEGEPNPVMATNPCGEIPLEPWEPCNLGHINLAAFADYKNEHELTDDLMAAHRLMTRFLIRATTSTVADPKSAEVLARNRRIGVGHLGLASFMAKFGVSYSEIAAEDSAEFLRGLAEVVDKEAQDYAHQLRIPVPVKSRTVAPTGTVAKLAGVSEGIHPIFADYFIRRIRFSTIDPDQVRAVDYYRARGYRVEDCLYAGDTVVVAIPTKDSLLAEVEERFGTVQAAEIVQSPAYLTLTQMLRVQVLYQQYWADNAVSYTANIGPEKYTVEDLTKLLSQFGPYLKGVTVFPESSMPQAPYERISKEQYESFTNREISDSVDEECVNGCPIK